MGMKSKQAFDWLRIVEVKKSILTVALCLSEDEIYTRENAINDLIKIADSVHDLEEIHLEEVEKAEVELYFKSEEPKECIDLDVFVSRMKTMGCNTTEAEAFLRDIVSKKKSAQAVTSSVGE